MLLGFELPGEPKGKGRPRFVRATGRAFTPQRTVSYEGELKLAADKAMGGRPLFEGPLHVSIRANFAVPSSWSAKKIRQAQCHEILPTKKPDADNLAKMLDALNGVVWHDDKQVTLLSVEKLYSTKPSLQIRVARHNGAVLED